MRNKFKPTIPPRSGAPRRVERVASAASSRTCDPDGDKSTEDDEIDGEEEAERVASSEKEPEVAVPNRRKRITPNLASLTERKRARRSNVACASGDESREISTNEVRPGNDDDPTGEEDGAQQQQKRRRRRRMNSTSEMPADRSKMTMRDLIYHNPKTNPMKQRDETNKSAPPPPTPPPPPPMPPHESDHDNNDGDEEEEGLLVPQVKVGPDGSVIIDQASLTVSPTKHQQSIMETSDAVYEDSRHVTSASFRRRHSVGRMWKKDETERFYDILSRVGTDFGLMASLFPGRTRKEVKAKFKREEKANEARINEAIQRSVPISEETFTLAGDNDDDDDDDDIDDTDVITAQLEDED